MIFTYYCLRHIKAMVLQSYYRLEAWAEDLSRLKFGIVVGIGTFFGVFAMSLLLQELTSVYAVMMGVTMGIVYYAFDPR